MARAGRSATIGRTTRTGKKKDFAGSGAEGEKTAGNTEDDMPNKLQQIVAAIGNLNPETDFTGGGKPKVEALEAVLGFDISAEERDAAWQASEEPPAPDEAAAKAETTEEPPAAAPKKDGPLTIADVVKAKRAQGMKI
jgi:hypothetical protein